MSDLIDKTEQGVGATQETVSKLRPDPFWLLYTRGRLDKDPNLNARMFDAGLEIRKTFGLITAPVSLKCHDYEREVKSLDFGARERILAKHQIFVRRYVEWADAMNHRCIPIGPVLDVTIEGLPCVVVDRGRRRVNGWTGRLLREGLRLYCDIAGWLRHAA